MKKFFAFVLAMVMVATLFVGCSTTTGTTVHDSHNDSDVTIFFADLVQVPGYKYLYYSVNTYDVYYLYIATSGYSFMESYLSNGNHCQYIDGEIVEVVNGEIVAVVEITAWGGKNAN